MKVAQKFWFDYFVKKLGVKVLLGVLSKVKCFD
jgi:hypothetical protein